MAEARNTDVEFNALIAFKNSIGRPFKDLRWPYRMKVPRQYEAWKLRATHVERLTLFLDAGLADKPLFEGRAMFEEMLHKAEIDERTAWSAWCARKAAMEMDLLCGRRRKLPWSC